MRFYYNKESKKLIIAQQWSGLKKDYKYLTNYNGSAGNDFNYTLPDSDLSNVRYLNHKLLLTDYMNHVVQIVHIGDYIIYRANRDKEVMRYIKINKDRFKSNYKVLPISKPTTNSTYIIERLNGTLDTNTPILILGSKKQGQRLVKYLNYIANNPEFDDYYKLFKMPNDNKLNFLTYIGIED